MKYFSVSVDNVCGEIYVHNYINFNKSRLFHFHIGFVFCNDKTKLEELVNLYILMGGPTDRNYSLFSGDSAERRKLLRECARLLGEL